MYYSGKFKAYSLFFQSICYVRDWYQESIFADAPDGCSFIMMESERLRVLQVHHLLILLACHANSYGWLSTPCFNRVLPDEKNSLRLLDHYANPSGQQEFWHTSLIMSQTYQKLYFQQHVFSWCRPPIVSYDDSFNYTMAGTCTSLIMTNNDYVS